MLDFETGIRLIRFTSESWIFKGTGLVVLSFLALLFAFVTAKRGRKIDVNFIIFIALAVLILVYGIVILVLQPQWWKPPV